MHTGAYHVKLVFSCAALHSRTATHSNTRKPTSPYLLQSQGSSSEHVFIPLILEHGLGTMGCSEEPSRNGGGTSWQKPVIHSVVLTSKKYSMKYKYPKKEKSEPTTEIYGCVKGVQGTRILGNANRTSLREME